MALRGPYLLAYLGILGYPIAANPIQESVAWTMWSILMVVIGTALVIGSLGSWLVINDPKHPHRWLTVSVLEVTGLKAFILLEYLYATWMLFLTDRSIASTLIHVVVGSLALGVLANMAWRKSPRPVKGENGEQR